MAESQLSVSYSKLRQIVGRHLGYTRDAIVWSAEQSADVEEAIASGMRQFYWPPATDKKRHEWSFLRPLRTVSLVASTAAYNLPDDFGGVIDGGMTLPGGEKISIISELDLRTMQAKRPASGRPAYAAVRIRDIAGADGQRFELIVYPTPDASGTASYRGPINPPTLSAAAPYPLGGTVHAETIVESCLSMADVLHNDMPEGPHYAKFVERLAASIAFDMKAWESASVVELDETSLTSGVTYNYLLARIGHVLGFGLSPSSWDYAQMRQARMVLLDAVAMIGNPPPVGGRPYYWNFLRPAWTFDTVVGQWIYSLPRDFASFDGPIVPHANASRVFRQMRKVGERDVLNLRRQQPNLTGMPCVCAVRPVTGSAGEPVHELLVFPTPDESASYSMRYKVVMRPLSDENQHPYGAMEHANLYVEACLYKAELHMGNSRGPHKEGYLEALAASIEADKQYAADRLGPLRMGPYDGPYVSRVREVNYVGGLS